MGSQERQNDLSVTHDNILNDEDFATLAYILGAYVGSVMRKAEKEGRDPVNSPEVVSAHEKCNRLREKLIELQNCQ